MAAQFVLVTQALCFTAAALAQYGASQTIGMLQQSSALEPYAKYVSSMVFILALVVSPLTAFSVTHARHLNKTALNIPECCLRVTSLAFIAAESCVLLCTDWATAYVLLVLVVPMWVPQFRINIKTLVVCTSALYAWSACMALYAL